MAMPTGSDAAFDARLTSTIKLGGVTASDGSIIDTWGTATNPTAGSEPVYDSISLGGGPCITGGGQGAPLYSRPTTINAPSTSLSVPSTTVVVFRADGAAVLAELSSNVSSAEGFLQSSNGGWAAQVHGPSGLQNTDVAQGDYWGMGNTVMYVVQTNDGTTMDMYINGVLVGSVSSGTAPGIGSFSTVISLLADHAAARALTGAIGLLYHYPRVWTPSDFATADADIRASWRLTDMNERQLYNVILLGDSIGAGAHTQTESVFIPDPNRLYSFGNIACAQLGFRFGSYINYAVSGAQLVAITASWASLGQAATVTGKRNIVICEGGINDLGDWPGGIVDSASQAAATAAINSRMQTYIQTVSAGLSGIGGPQNIFVCTITYEAGANSFFEAARQAINANTVANYASWGAANVTMGLADFGADVVLGTPAGNWPGNQNYFESSGLHPVKPGHQRAGAILANAMITAGL